MGRKSKLSPEQWAAIQKRVLAGESLRSLAKEFGVSESTAREKISAQTAQIKTVANQIVATERAIQSLPISAQITAHNLASKLRSISDDLLEGVAHQASTFRKLSAIVTTEMMKVDETDPMSTADKLKTVALVTEMANNSAKTPINVLVANKDEVSKANNPANKASMTLDDFYGGTKSQSSAA